jgi:SNF2 family DNA or RNA helicase
MTFCVNISLDKSATRVVFSLQEGEESRRPFEFNQWILTSLEQPDLIFSERFSISIFSFLSSLKALAQIHEISDSFDLTIEDDRVLELVESYKESASLLAEYDGNLNASVQESNLMEQLVKGKFRRANGLSSDQLRDICRMAYLKHSANFSVPGAGKTTALLAVYVYEKQISNIQNLLVVAPRNALGSWEIEVNQCLTDKHVVRLTGGKERVQRLLEQNPEIATISYQQLRTCTDVIAKHLVSHRVQFVLDEAHRAKAGLRSQQGQSVLELAPLARRRDILTGTPMPQGISDIESQIAFLWPGQTVFDDSRDIVNQVSAAKESIKSLYVRTRKSELGLPIIHFKYHAVKMDSWQKDLYSLLARKIVSQISNFSLEDEAQLRKLGKQIMRNILFCADPDVFSKSLARTPEYRDIQIRLGDLSGLDSAKLTYLDSLVSQILSNPEEKVVIWSTFTAVIEKISARYSMYKASFIHGGVETDDEVKEGSREWVIEQFHSNPNKRVLVANPAACGEGISLHHASHNAIYFDRSFNAAHYLQSIDRIHRRGLPPDTETYVHVLFLKETIEEVIRDRLSGKVKALEVLLDDPDLVRMVYDPEDEVSLGLDQTGLDMGDIQSLREFLTKAAE